MYDAAAARPAESRAGRSIDRCLRHASDWLVKNVPGNNGRVGIIGVSYEGWTSLMALFDSHPALKAAIPMNAMVDGWVGDDWYHNGAFRQFSLEYVYRQTTVKGANEIPMGSRDAYATYSRGSANEMAKSRNMDQLPAWKKSDRQSGLHTVLAGAGRTITLLARVPVTVPTLIVHGQFDHRRFADACAAAGLVDVTVREIVAQVRFPCSPGSWPGHPRARGAPLTLPAPAVWRTPRRRSSTRCRRWSTATPATVKASASLLVRARR